MFKNLIKKYNINIVTGIIVPGTSPSGPELDFWNS